MASIFGGRVEQLNLSAPEIAQQEALSGAHHQCSRMDAYFDFRPRKDWDPGSLVVEDFLTEEQEAQILESLGRV